MVIGQRKESITDRDLRHIQEMKNDIEGWKSELKFARKQLNIEYEKHCSFMIEVCKNTLKNLESICII